MKKYLKLGLMLMVVLFGSFILSQKTFASTLAEQPIHNVRGVNSGGSAGSYTINFTATDFNGVGAQTTQLIGNISKLSIYATMETSNPSGFIIANIYEHQCASLRNVYETFGVNIHSNEPLEAGVKKLYTWDIVGTFEPTKCYSLDLNSQNDGTSVTWSLWGTDVNNTTYGNPMNGRWPNLTDFYFKIEGTIPTLSLPISQLNGDTVSTITDEGGSYLQELNHNTDYTTQNTSIQVASISGNLNKVYAKFGLDSLATTNPVTLRLWQFTCATTNRPDYRAVATVDSTDQSITSTAPQVYSWTLSSPFSFDPTKCYDINFYFHGSGNHFLEVYGSIIDTWVYGHGTKNALSGETDYDQIEDVYFILEGVNQSVSNLNQVKSNTSTQISESSIIPQSSISFKATPTSPHNLQSKLEVELKKFNQPFDGTNTQLSSLINSGSDAIVTINNLSDGDYHWRARTVDSSGSTSNWQEFGTAGNTDFTVQKPIIIVPGILGSWWKKALPVLSNGEMVLDPILGVYNNLVSGLNLNGYTKDVDLFPFPYDWRNDNKITAEVLVNKIAAVKDICDCDKVNIVAHSMGGLVSRYYIESDLYQGDVDQLFLVGVPNDGGPDAYLTWEAGEMRSGILQFFLTMFANYELYPDIFSYVRLRPLTSVQQTLPTYNYLRDASSGNLKHYPTGYPLNTFLDKSDSNGGLNSPSKLANLTSSGVKITNIVGDNITDTLDTIRVANSILFWPRWADGFSEGYYNFFGDHGLEVSNGDGTVPITSSMSLLTPGITLKRVNGKHGELPTISLPIILETLRSAPQSPLPQIPLPKTVLFIPISHSADIQVIDPLGRKVGKNFATNTDITEISNAYYTGFQNPDMEFVAIPDPIDGDYKIITEGVSSGSYETSINYAKDRDLITKKFGGNTTNGLTSEIDFTLNNGNPANTQIVPKDQTPPTTTISLSGIQGSNGWYKSDVTATLSAIDNNGGVGVYRTDYSLDNGTTWNEYSAPLVISTELSNNTIQYRSQDYVHNLESTHTQTFKLDKTAPNTSILLSGTQGTNSWHTSNVTVTLSATDNLSGISTKEYSLNNGSTWITYSSPLTISNEGTTTLQYRSKDNAGNMETVKSQIIKIDKTPPEAKISFSTSTGLPQIDGVDNVGTTTVTKVDNSNYTVKDEAGHTLKIKLTAVSTAPTLKNPAVLDMLISSLQYDSKSAISLPITNLHYEWLGSPITLLNESISVLKQFSVTGVYDPVKKNTVIVTTQNNLPTTQTLAGLKIIKLKTINGGLGWEY